MRKGFTRPVAEYPNWFEQIAKANFEEFLLPLKGKDDLRLLQLGAFTGDASVWMADNIMNESSKLTDVDTWEGAPNEPVQEAMDFEDVYKTYLRKIEKYNIHPHRTTTQEFLMIENYEWGLGYDFIYVDAHHTAASAFLDSELSWPLLKSGGLLAIDDYEWEHPDGNPIHAPKLGIKMFLDRHRGKFDLLALNSQCWLRKK